uniref:Mitochondrial import receptor subunit TOM22 homolog n=1 Tax=Sus scrofa TaxID=9823 RepID=A0A8D1VFT5_PIG
YIRTFFQRPTLKLTPTKYIPQRNETRFVFLDETLSERLWGLTEMFPERVRSAAGATFDLSLFVAQKMYRFSRAALWIGTTSFMILVLPVVFETEKLQMEQQQQLQQRQILLGPNTGLSGGMPGALPSLPGKI